MGHPATCRAEIPMSRRLERYAVVAGRAVTSASTWISSTGTVFLARMHASACSAARRHIGNHDSTGSCEKPQPHDALTRGGFIESAAAYAAIPVRATANSKSARLTRRNTATSRRANAPSAISQSGTAQLDTDTISVGTSRCAVSATRKSSRLLSLVAAVNTNTMAREKHATRTPYSHARVMPGNATIATPR